MKLSYSLFSVLSLLMNVATASAQPKDTILLTPGHAILQGVKLAEGKSEFAFIQVKDGKEKKVGGLQEDLRVVIHNGASHYLRICQIKFGNNTILDSGLAGVSTLHPVYHRSYQSNKLMQFDFTGSLVTGFVNTDDTAGHHVLPVRQTESHVLFDSYYEDIIARSLPLVDGFTFKFPEYIYERGGLVWSTGVVQGSEKLQEKDGDAAALWKIRFYEHDKSGAVTRETRYVIDGDYRNILSREYIMGKTRIVMVPVLHVKD